MKVALVIPELDPRRGGAETWTAQYLHWLLAHGHQVHLLSRSLHGLHHPRLHWHPLPGVKDPWQLAVAAEQVLAGLSVDVAHDLGVGWSAQVFQPHGGSRLASWECGLDAVAAWLRPWKRWAWKCLPRYRRWRRLAQRQFENPRRIYIALSQMVQEHFVRYHGLPSQQIRLIYNGVDLKRFDPQRFAQQAQALRRRYGVGAHEVVLLVVAHNFRLKGVPELLEAMRRVGPACRRLRVWIVGGKHWRRWARRVARWDRAGQVRFFGPVEDTRPFYAACDVLVHPTHYDPCSLVVLEALAMGVPVVTTTRNGAAERMQHGVHGWVLPAPANAEQLAMVLTHLAHNHDLARMRQAVWLLRPHLDHARNFQAVFDCYHQCRRPAQAA